MILFSINFLIKNKMYHGFQKILKQQHSRYSLTTIALCAQCLRLLTVQKSH